MAVIRRPLALAAAVATATTLGATALTTPAYADDPAPAAAGGPPKIELKDGTLTWGVRESFRDYVTGPISGGKIQVADGAKQAAKNGAFTFTGGKGSYDLSQHAVATTFKGSVRFLGHPKKGGGWELDIKFANLKLATKAKTGSITADVTADGKTRKGVAVASLDLSKVKPGGGAKGTMTFAKIPAKLTAAGAKAFVYHKNGKDIPFYKAGDPLDPATLSVRTGSPQKPVPPKPPKKPVGAAGAMNAAESPAPSNSPAPSAPSTSLGSTSSGSPKAAAESGTVYDGNLDWGVKKSFRDYVTGSMANGKIELSAGAQKSGDGYRFIKGTGSYDASAATLDASFDGMVRFLGHQEKGAWKLDTKLSKLKIKVTGATGTVYADVSSVDRKSGQVVNTAGMPLADLKLPTDALKAKDGVITLSAVPATVTAQGVKTFGSYHVGDAVDPVTAAIAVDKNAQLPDGSSGSSADSTGKGTNGGDANTGDAGTGGSGGAKGGVTGNGEDALANTGSSTPTAPLAGGAAALVLAGGAAVYATRRRTSGRG